MAKSVRGEESYSRDETLEEQLQSTKDFLTITWNIIDYIKKFPDVKYYPVDFDDLNLGQYIVERTKKVMLDHKIGILSTAAFLDEVFGLGVARTGFGLFGVQLPVMTSFYLGMGILTSPITDKIVNYFIDLRFQNKTLKEEVKDKADYVWNRDYKK